MTIIEDEPEVEWWPSVPEDWAESNFGLDYTAADWQDQGICAQVDPELWFPEIGHKPDAAKQVCAVCPVRERCLDWALANGAPSGVWGGLTEAERRPLRRDRPCGLNGCQNPRGFGADGSRRKYCSDACFAVARIGARRRAA